MNLQFKKEYSANDAILLIVSVFDFSKKNWVHTLEGQTVKDLLVRQLINLVSYKLTKGFVDLHTVKVLTIGEVVGIISSITITEKIILTFEAQTILLNTVTILVNKLDTSAQLTNYINSIMEKEIHTLN